MNLDFQPVVDAVSAREYDDIHLQRVFHGRGHCYGELTFITVDWYPPALFICLFRPVCQDWLDQLTDAVWQVRPEHAKCMVVQHRQGPSTYAEVMHGELPREHIVTERDTPNFAELAEEQDTPNSAGLTEGQDTPNSAGLIEGQGTPNLNNTRSGIKFHVRLNKAQNVGIFPDMALGRAWVRTHSQQAKVLNLFSYTCGFSLAAMMGEASKVVNVDMNKAVIATGRKNHELNGIRSKSVKFLPHNIFTSWGKIKREGPYELIVIDPPSFQKGSFELTKDYQKLVRRLPELAAPGAKIMLCANSPDVSTQYLLDLVEEYGCTMMFIKRLGNHPDFPEADKQKGLKVLLFEFGQ